MKIICSYCQKSLEAPDESAGGKGKCPRCGEVFEIPGEKAKTEEVILKRKGWKSGIFGAVLGFGFAGFGILLGVLLLFTGIGAPMGVGIILASFLIPLIVGAMFADDMYGNCPYCDSRINVSAEKQGINCPGCDKRFLVKGEKLIPA